MKIHLSLITLFQTESIFIRKNLNQKMIRKFQEICQDCQDCQDCQECQDCQDCQDCQYLKDFPQKKIRVLDSIENVFYLNYSVLSQEEISKEFFIENSNQDTTIETNHKRVYELKEIQNANQQNNVFDKILEGKYIKRPYYLQNYRPDDWTSFPANPNGMHIVDLYFHNTCSTSFEKFSKQQKICAKKFDEIPIKKYEFGYWYMFHNPNLETFRCNWESMVSQFDTRDWFRLSSCSGAVNLLEKNIDKIHLIEICRNKSQKAMALLQSINDCQDFHDYSEYTDYEKWEFLCENPFAGTILRENLTNLNWMSLSRNKSQEAMKIFEEYFYLCMLQNEYVIEESLSNLSRNEFAIPFLERNPAYIDWKELSKNPRASALLEKNIDKIDWLSLAVNPGAINLLEKNIEKFFITEIEKSCMDSSFDLFTDFDTEAYSNIEFKKKFWTNLCFNPNATRILSKHLDYIDIKQVLSYIQENGQNLCSVVIEHFQDNIKDWTPIMSNPNIVHILFPLDLEKMFLSTFHLHQELLAKVMCPERISKMSQAYNVSTSYYLSLYNF